LNMFSVPLVCISSPSSIAIIHKFGLFRSKICILFSFKYLFL
jgi:hypothetical protein